MLLQNGCNHHARPVCPSSAITGSSGVPASRPGVRRGQRHRTRRNIRYVIAVLMVHYHWRARTRPAGHPDPHRLAVTFDACLSTVVYVTAYLSEISLGMAGAVGESGLATSAGRPGMLAAVDQHAAEVRDALAGVGGGRPAVPARRTGPRSVTRQSPYVVGDYPTSMSSCICAGQGDAGNVRHARGTAGRGYGLGLSRPARSCAAGRRTA
jgi:hypothetical protein